jgi:phosphoribosylglycinamide formyltransferase 1
MTNIAVFASGAGSNAQKIIEYFSHHPAIAVRLLVSNKPEAGALDLARRAGIETLVIEKERFFRGDAYLGQLKEKGIGFIVLAGFLWKIPPALVAAYPEKIVNIHPALLPRYGGKGMYGRHVHEAVLASGDKTSGITIHFVDDVYDHGKIIRQSTCEVMPGDSPETLAAKIHALEHRDFAPAIEMVIEMQNRR